MLHNQEQLRLQQEEQRKKNYVANATTAAADVYEHDEYVS